MTNLGLLIEFFLQLFHGVKKKTLKTRKTLIGFVKHDNAIVTMICTFLDVVF